MPRALCSGPTLPHPAPHVQAALRLALGRSGGGAGEGAAGGAAHEVLYTSYPLTLPRAPAHTRYMSQRSI
jgi:hypothetical protein